MTSTSASLTAAAPFEVREIEAPFVAFARAEQTLAAAGFEFTTECVGSEPVCPRLLLAVAA
ncbi:hypothetical protein BH23ACT5_BH23ACT5_05610 [soil metagenome]